MDPLALLISVLLTSLLGATIGAAAGLVPGLHINNVSYLMASSSAALGGVLVACASPLGSRPGDAPLLVASMMVSALVAHLFTSLLPSVFLGAPDPGRALSVLPAHRMLLAGRGLEAVRLSLTGCVGGLAACIAALPLFRLIMGDPVEAYGKLRPSLALVLILITIVLIVSEPASGPARPRGRERARCVLVLERVRSAALVLSSREENDGAPPEGARYHPDGGRGGTGAPFPRAPAPVADIRPWAAPQHAGERVRVCGVVSERRERGGLVSFVVEEGSALRVLVPPGLAPGAGDARVGEVVVVEGWVAPVIRSGRALGRRLLATALFLSSGFLGVLVLASGRIGAHNWFPLGSPPVPDAAMLFPLFCGLFGLPTLLLGTLDAPSTPPQRDESRPLSSRRMLRGVLTGSLAGGLLGWFPGMTAAHGAVIARLFSGDDDGAEGESDRDGGREERREIGNKETGKRAGLREEGAGGGEARVEGTGDGGLAEGGAGPGRVDSGAGSESYCPGGVRMRRMRLAGSGTSGEDSGGIGGDDSTREFLIAVSAVTVANTFFNIVALFVILRARSGALHMTQLVLEGGLSAWWPATLVPPAFALLVVAAASSAALALPVTLRLGRALARLYDRVPYRKVQAGVVCLLVALLLVFSGAAGLAVAAAGICLGLIPPLAGVRRVHLMGAILLPVILLLLGVDGGVMGFLRL
ncbi:MAG: tripartite tricarboxylate transporter permease [Thermoplasmatota archaeon]